MKAHDGCIYVKFQVKQLKLNHVHKVALNKNPLYGPRLDKTCLRGFGKSETPTSLLSYRD